MGKDKQVVQLEIVDSIDLHSFSPREIPSVVESYLEEAFAEGFDEVRIIHGRGTGFQRERVRQVLSESPYVESFCDAPPNRGGWGAQLVRLKDE